MKYLLILFIAAITTINLAALEESKWSGKSRSAESVMNNTPETKVVFSEWDEPETPSIENVIFNRINFLFKPFGAQPITIIPSGSAFTLDGRDRGDISHDPIYDALKALLNQRLQNPECALEEMLISFLISKELPPHVSKKKINFERIKQLKTYAHRLKFKELEIIADSFCQPSFLKGKQYKLHCKEAQRELTQKQAPARNILEETLAAYRMQD